MPFPKTSLIENPILLELSAVGGTDDVRFLYERLIPYFPQLEAKQIAAIRSNTEKNWRSAVQRAGKSLEESNLIRRRRGIWRITERGRDFVKKETSGFTLTVENQPQLNHQEVQELLVKIGQTLGFYAETEYEYYDVVWRESKTSPRISHVFEVQSKGNIDSAFAKLKRAYQIQRTLPFLILSTERDFKRARKSLQLEHSELKDILVILTFVQIQKVFQNIDEIGFILSRFLEK